MSSKTLADYDLIPYPAYSFPQSHPDRAAAIATLLGLSPPPVEHCRVLEIGCAAGSNLIPMAEELPQSTFVGIDLSRRHIDDGRQALAEVGLSNVELRHQSILDVEPGAETFDYIICHGVFSWVPPEAQDRILAVARHCLGPNGIAYISYNTLPAWHMRGIIRDMMLYHGRRYADPRRQISEARRVLAFMASSLPGQDSPYVRFLRSELENLRQSSDAYLFHDFLEEHNLPLYFHQFVERAASHGLGYLADAELHTMEIQNLPDKIGQALQRASTDRVQMEQYMDFLLNRSFRQTLLVHARQAPRYRLEPETLTPFFVSSPLRPGSARPDLRGTNREDFTGPFGSSAYTHNPLVKAALVVLGRAWPEALPFPELCSRVRAELEDGPGEDSARAHADRQEIGESLLRYYTISNYLVEFRLRRLPVTSQPGPRPLARPLARWQAGSGRPVVTCRHVGLALDPFVRQTLLRLDGQHTRAALVQELTALVQNGQLTLPQRGETGAAPRPVEEVVREALGQQIEHFTREALLLA